MSFDKVEIGNVCDVGRGSSPRPIDNSAYFIGGTIPWIKIADATASGKYIYQTKEVVNEFGASFSRLLQPGALIIATSGVSLGQIKFLGVEGCIHDGWLYVNNFRGVDKEFLYYHLLTMQDEFLGRAYGAAIQNINTTILRESKINLPPLPTQRKIASILSAYDDLIENNLKRIKLLEEKAFASYKLIMKSEKLKTLKLNEVTQTLKRGISPKYVIDDGIVVLNQKCIRNHIVSFEESRLTDSENKPSEERMIQKFDTIINSTGTGTLGRMAMNIQNEIPLTVDSHVTIVRANNSITPIFLGQSLLAKEHVVAGMGEGSTNQTELSARKLGEELKIEIPSKEVMHEFEEEAEPIFNLIWNLQKQNTKLREARDILLPRLMSGEIEL